MKPLRMVPGLMAVVLACNVACADGWQFRVGWVRQWGMKMSVDWPALSLPGDIYGPPLPGLPFDNVTLLGDRTFADGYVRQDLWTASPAVPPPYAGSTWNWGYDNPGQFSTEAVTFHQNAARRTGSSGTGDFSADGLEVAAEHQLLTWHALDAGVSFGLAWFPDAQAANRRWATDQVRTYVYDNQFGVVPPLPPPYRGPDFNGLDPYGNPWLLDMPIIPDRPLSVTDTLEMHNVTTKADLNRLRLACGPTMNLAVTGRVRLHVVPQVTLNIVDIDVDRQETWTVHDTSPAGLSRMVASQADHSREQVWVPGFLLTAGADVNVTENWFVGVNIGREWAARRIGVDVGTDRAQFDIGGIEVECYLGRAF